MEDRKIMFKYEPANGRSWADCMDTYNWLLDQDKKIAKEFYKKYIASETSSKKQYEKRLASPLREK